MTDQSDEPQPQPPPGVKIIIDPAMMAGVWANFAFVSHSEHEFSIDFIRRDTANPSQAIVVARVAVSPLFIMQLIDALQGNWAKYAAKAMPKEVQDAGSTSDNPDDPKT